MKINTKYVKFCSNFRSLTNQISGIDHVTIEAQNVFGSILNHAGEQDHQDLHKLVEFMLLEYCH